jgi:cytochrome b pre-mRNA-processing protein 3
MIFSLFSKNPWRARAEELFRRTTLAARQPAIFAAHGVPDTVEGRFEVMSLHVILILRRLQAIGPEADALGQEFIDRFFASLDGAVRAIGIGDLSVGKKVKAYARHFYGRAEAYDAALKPGAAADALVLALSRHLFGAGTEIPPGAAPLAAYVRESEVRLAGLSLAAFDSDQPLFATERL